jgi:hypothetical protein
MSSLTFKQNEITAVNVQGFDVRLSSKTFSLIHRLGSATSGARHLKRHEDVKRASTGMIRSLELSAVPGTRRRTVLMNDWSTPLGAVMLGRRRDRLGLPRL